MWIIRWFFILSVMILVLFIAIQNANETSRFTFFSQAYLNVPLIILLFAAYVVGMITWFIIAVIQNMQLKIEIRNLRKETVQLQHELDDLRNISIDEDGEEPGE